MQRDRFVSVLLAVSPESAKLLKSGTGKIKPATDATKDEKAAVTRWIGYKSGVKPTVAKAKAAAKPAKGDYTNSKGNLYRRVVTETVTYVLVS